MKKKILILALCLLCALTAAALAACMTVNDNGSGGKASQAPESTASGEETAEKTPVQYVSVTWKNYDGTVLERKENQDVGSTPKFTLATPVKESDKQYEYVFNGWLPEVGPVSEDTVYTAQFTSVLKYAKITLDYDGGTTSSSTGTFLSSGINPKSFPYDLKKAGYQFKGWSYNGVKVLNQNGELVSDPGINETMVFKAIFKDKTELTIGVNDSALGSVSGAGEYDFNSSVAVTAKPKTGCSFVGWYYNGLLLATTYQYNYQMWSDDVHLEAVFKKNTYKLTVISNLPTGEKVSILASPAAPADDAEGESAAPPVASPMEKAQQEFEYQSLVTVSSLTASPRKFLGWFTKSGDLVATDGCFTFQMPASDYTLIAKWEEIYTEYGNQYVSVKGDLWQVLAHGSGRYLLYREVDRVKTGAIDDYPNSDVQKALHAYLYGLFSTEELEKYFFRFGVAGDYISAPDKDLIKRYGITASKNAGGILIANSPGEGKITILNQSGVIENVEPGKNTKYQECAFIYVDEKMFGLMQNEYVESLLKK